MEGDPTEMVRRRFMVELARGLRKEELGLLYGAVWDSTELARNYEVLGFVAPFVVVRRLSDGKMGSLAFQHNPRFYFNWVEDDADE